MLLFHVTTATAAESIREHGLRPAIGPRASQLGETVPAIYFFTSESALQAASDNWLSEAFEDVEEPLVVLVVDVSAQVVRIDPAAAFEAAVTVPVAAAAVVRAYDIDTGAAFPAGVRTERTRAGGR